MLAVETPESSLFVSLWEQYKHHPTSADPRDAILSKMFGLALESYLLELRSFNSYINAIRQEQLRTGTYMDDGERESLSQFVTLLKKIVPHPQEAKLIPLGEAMHQVDNWSAKLVAEQEHLRQWFNQEARAEANIIRAKKGVRRGKILSMVGFITAGASFLTFMSLGLAGVLGTTVTATTTAAAVATATAVGFSLIGIAIVAAVVGIAALCYYFSNKNNQERLTVEFTAKHKEEKSLRKTVLEEENERREAASTRVFAINNCFVEIERNMSALQRPKMPAPVFSAPNRAASSYPYSTPSTTSDRTNDAALVVGMVVGEALSGSSHHHHHHHHHPHDHHHNQDSGGVYDGGGSHHHHHHDSGGGYEHHHHDSGGGYEHHHDSGGWSLGDHGGDSGGHHHDYGDTNDYGGTDNNDYGGTDNNDYGGWDGP